MPAHSLRILYRVFFLISPMILSLIAGIMDESGQAETLIFSDFLDHALRQGKSLEKYRHELTNKEFLPDLIAPAVSTSLGADQSYIRDAVSGAKHSVKSVLSQTRASAGNTLSLRAGQERDSEGQKTSIGAEILQSVWKNAFGSAHDLAVKKAVGEIEISRLQAQESLEQDILRLSRHYLDWQLCYLNFMFASELYQQSEKMLADVRKRARDHIASSLDLQKAGFELLERKQKLLDNESAFSAASAAVSDLTGLSENITPSENPDDQGILIDFEKDPRSFSESARTVQILQKQLLLNQLEGESRQDEKKPDLGLMLGYQLDPDKGTHGPYAGIHFSWTFDNPGLRAQISEVSYKTVQKRFEFERLLIETESRFSALREQLVYAKKREALLDKKWKLASAIYQKEYLQFQQGQSDLRDLIASGNSLSQSRFELLKQKVLSVQLKAEWAELSDTLLSEKILSRIPGR